jgi:hypothetical protein
MSILKDIAYFIIPGSLICFFKRGHIWTESPDEHQRTCKRCESYQVKEFHGEWYPVKRDKKLSAIKK